MFDEWRTRFSPLSNRWIRLARGPPGLARTFSDWGTAGPVPSRDRADGFEYVGRGGRVCANCSRPSPTARCRRRQPKPNSEGTSSARRADSMRPATGVAGSRRRFSQRGRPPHRSLHWPKPRSRRRGGRCSRASPTNSSSDSRPTSTRQLRRRRSTGEGAVRVTTPAYDPPSLDATVGIATGGTVDGPVADEAELVCLDAGATVDRVDDIGVAALTRTLDQLDRFREADVLVVAAGREGRSRPSSPASSTPRSSALRSRAGYGHARGRRGGTRRDAPVVYRAVGRQHRRGFVAGAQATLIARAIDAARD